MTQAVDEGDLRHVREFVNTRNIEAGTDALRTDADLDAWLGDRGWPGGDGVTRAIRLREAVRALLEVNHDGTAGPEAEAAAAVLNQAARRYGLHAAFTPESGWRLAPRDGAGLGHLLVVITEAMSTGSWRRLKVCRSDGCRWAFFDASKSGAGKWCSMAICGNREKARAWRARQRLPETSRSG